MQYKKLGRTGTIVSRICLGTMNWGPHTEEKDAFRLMDMALDAGINYFDTANNYGAAGTIGYKGWTEEIIGRWFAQGGNRRERVVLATKLYDNMQSDRDGINNFQGLSSRKIRRHLEDSLVRLQTDHVDVYQMHHVDRHAGWEELWEAFEGAVRAGKTIHIGASNFAAWHLAKAQAAAKGRNFMGIVSTQEKYNLLCRLLELEVLPACQDFGIAFNAWSPLDGGMLNGKAFSPDAGSRGTARDKDGNFTYNAAYAEAHRAKFEAFSDLCAEIGENEAVVAMAWLLSNPGLTSVIMGPRTIQHLEVGLRATEIELSHDVKARLEEIFPGPGKRGRHFAPEAYAW